MGLLGRFFLSCILSFFTLAVVVAQENPDSLAPQDSSEVLLDSVATSFDSFNYVYPPADRESQLLAFFLSEIQEKSIDFVKMIRDNEVARQEYAVSQGQAKILRPMWVLYVVFFLFLAVAVIRLLFPGELEMILHAYLNERALQQVSKEDNMLTSWPYVLLYLVFSLSLGLFIVAVNAGLQSQLHISVEQYLKTSLIVAALFISKILFIRFISFVFELNRLMREYVAVLYLVYFNSMFFLLPFLLAVVFVPTHYFKIILILFSVLASMLFVYRFLRTAIRLFGNHRFSLFYLILYLCALEVAPILILVKTLSD